MTDTPPAAPVADVNSASATAATLASAVGNAASGPSSPDSVKVSQPIHSAIWSLFAGLAMVCTFGIIIIGVLSDPFNWMQWLPNTQLARIKWLGWMGMVAIGTVPLFAFAIASPWVGRVEASAGTNKIVLDGRT